MGSNRRVRIAARARRRVPTHRAVRTDSRRVLIYIYKVVLVTENNRATSHNQDMIALLRDLRPQVSHERQARIDDLLASVSGIQALLSTPLMRTGG